MTTLCVHPSGHLFAVGYADGCIAFWAVEDEDKALQVRTVDDVDVNIADGEKLAAVLSSHPSDGASTTTSSKSMHLREPIFKICWSGMEGSSDAYEGHSALTILGGLHPQNGNGVSVLLLEKFAPSAVSVVSPTNKNIHPAIRAAMVESLQVINTWFYDTLGPTQDFLLIPRDSPHFAGTSHPVSILLLSGAEAGGRSIEGREFPPSEFTSSLSAPGEADPADIEKPSDILGEDLAEVLQELQLSREPRKLSLPSTLWTGIDAILDGDIIHLEKDVYNRLVGSAAAAPNDCPIKGGVAWADAEGNNAKAMKSAKVRNTLCSDRRWR